MGALKAFWNCPYIHADVKHLVYLAIPMSTVLWGCESWSITAQMQQRLEAFHHKSLRHIMGITMFHVQELQISNLRVRQELNVPTIMSYITRRQLQWIHKIAIMPDERVPPKLLASWVHHPRKCGCPQITYRNSFAAALHQILPEVDPVSAMNKDWLHIAKDVSLWTPVFNNWWKGVQTPPLTSDEL